MIGKITRGSRVGGLLRYLFGPTRFETSPHTDAHLVAAWDGVDGIEPPTADNAVGFDVRQLTALLEAPLTYAERVPAKPVWHCSVRAAPTDRMLSDAEWADVAHSVVASVGLGANENRSGVRWAAVRHAPDHIHIVATLVREDGTPARLDFDKKALRSACIRIEERYGLRATAPADGTAVVGPSRAEIEKAERSGRSESVRETLRRHVRTAAAGALTEADFWRRLDAEGVLVRHRMSERNPGEITGYSVALASGLAEQPAAARTRDGDSLFFSGGKLSPELSLPKLRARWAGETAPLGNLELRQVDKRGLWRNVIESVVDAEKHVRHHTASGTYGHAADAVEATLQILVTAAVAVEGEHHRELRSAASIYERASRPPYGRRPAGSAHGDRLRLSAVALASVGGLRASGDRRTAALIGGLLRLVAAVEHLHRARDHVWQAGAAARARGQLEVLYRSARGAARANAPLTASSARRPGRQNGWQRTSVM